MATKKTQNELTPSQEALLNRLSVQRSLEELRAMAKEYGLECDLTSVQPALTELEATLEIKRRANEAVNAAQINYRLALKPCVASYEPPIEIGWVDQQFIDELNLRYCGDKAEAQRLLFELNKRKVASTELSRIIGYLEPAYRASGSTNRRMRNLLRFTGYGNEITHVVGRYTMTLKQAQGLAEWAIEHWRAGTASRSEDDAPRRRVSHNGDRYVAICYDDHIEIGCQHLAKEEVTRVAALMGWAGLPQQEGPDAPPPPAPKARRARKPETVDA